MDTPTPLQRQIEETVTNKRGYAPQITPINLATSLQFPKSLYIQNVYAFLERQRLEVTLQSMEAQQSSPTLGDSFIRYLEGILTDSPRPGSDIKPIKPNFEDSRMFSKITFKEKVQNNNSPSDWERIRRLYARTGVPPKPTDPSSFPWDSAKSRAYRDALRRMEVRDELRARQQNPFNPNTPFDDRSDPHAFDHLTSLEPRSQLPLKEREFLKLNPLPQHKEFPYKEEPHPLNRYITLEPKNNFEPNPETPPKRRDVYDILQSLPTPKPNSQFLPPRPNSNPMLEPREDQQFLDELLRKLDREKERGDEEERIFRKLRRLNRERDELD